MRTPNPLHDNGDYDSLASVSAVSSTDVWATGQTDDFDQPPYGYRTLFEHWNGSAWTDVPGADVTGFSWYYLTGIDALASNDVWAVGYENTSPYFSLIEHWDGTKWTVSDEGTADTYLTSVAAVAPNDVWAAGSTNYVGQGLLMHWDGTSWSRTIIPAAIVFRGITALGSNDIWAVGQVSTSYYGDHTVAMHWDGVSWTRYKTPSPLKLHSEDQNWLTSVTAVGSNDVWATGVARDHDWGIFDQPFIVHWDGTRWSMVPSPNIGGGNFDNDLWASAAFATDDVWAVGSVGNEPDWTTFTEHWDGTAWTLVPSPNVTSYQDNELVGATILPGTNQVMAVGYHMWSYAFPLVETWDGTAWTISPAPDTPIQGADLNGVSAVTATDVWAVGTAQDRYDAYHAFTAHWDGTAWSHVPSPQPGGSGGNPMLNGVDAVATNDVWAVGTYYNPNATLLTLALHWNGTRWRQVASQSPGGFTDMGASVFNGVSAISPADVRAVGYYHLPGYDPNHALIEMGC
jgi:hypothetical protein